jgi:hypothetical protein
VDLRTAVETKGVPNVGGRPVGRRTQHLRAGLDMDPPHLFGEPGQAGMIELEPRCRNEVVAESGLVGDRSVNVIRLTVPG